MSLLNILHLQNAARLEMASSPYFKAAITAIEPITISDSDELFLRLRLLFLCSTEEEGCAAILNTKHVARLFEKYSALIGALPGSEKCLNEVLSILYNLTVIGKDVKHTKDYIDVVQYMLALRSSSIFLRGKALLLLLESSYDDLKATSIEAGDIICLLEDIFKVEVTERTKLNMAGVYLAIVNICDAKESERKLLRQTILPAKQYNSLRPYFPLTVLVIERWDLNRTKGLKAIWLDH